MTAQCKETKKTWKAKHIPGYWNEKSFFAEMEEKLGTESVEVTRVLYDWANKNTAGNLHRSPSARLFLRVSGLDTQCESFSEPVARRRLGEPTLCLY